MAILGDTHSTVDHDHWNLPSSSNHEVNQLWFQIKKVEIPKAGFFRDNWVWLNSAIGNFSFKIACHDLRVHHPVVEWGKFLWPSNFITKHSCCAYKALLGLLPTMDRLQCFRP